MGFQDALKRLDAMAMNARYGGETVTFRLKNPVGSYIEFSGALMRDDITTKEQSGRYVEEQRSSVMGWISGTYEHESTIRTLVPDGNLFALIGGSWYRWESTLEGDQSGYLCEFKRSDIAGGSLQANRRN